MSRLSQLCSPIIHDHLFGSISLTTRNCTQIDSQLVVFHTQR